jgi:hypothetical protein
VTPQIYQKLFAALERDIRNQVVIDSLKRLNRKQKLMVQIHRHALHIVLFGCAIFWLLFSLAVVAMADELPLAATQTLKCPEPGQKCKVLFLTEQEENLLVGRNGILDTAAQGRQIDLGGFAVYFKSRIATAPAGEAQKLPEQVPKTDQPAK